MTEPLAPRSAHPPRRLWVAAGVGIALVAVLAAWLWLPRDRFASTPAAAPSVAATPRGTLAATGIFIEPEDGRAPVLDEIAAARRSIDLEIYLVTDEPVLQALEAAQARGVSVRVILEQYPFGGAGRQPEIFGRFEQAGIAVRWGNPVFRFTHLKRTGNPWDCC